MKETACPGAAAVHGTPTLEIKKCPECGTEVELFSTDPHRACENCGFVVYNDIQSCIRWCSKARECVGEEKYNELVMAQKKPDNPQ